MKWNGRCTLGSGRAEPVLGPPAQSTTSPPAILVSQISTQRRMNIYNILQEIIQQEGELEELCVQRLVAIASQEMRELPKVAGPWAPSGFPPHQSWPGLLVGMAWDAQSPRPVTSGGEDRLRLREPSRAGAGRGWVGFHEAPGGGGNTRPSPVPQLEGYVRAEVASDTLVALSRNHFSLVMYELQHHLKPLDLTDEFVIITLAKLAHGNGRARGTSAPASGPFGPAQGSLLVSASLHFCSCLCPTRSISLLPYLSLTFLFSCPRVFLSCEDSLCVSASHVGLYSSVIPSPPNRSLSLLPLRLHSCHLPFSRGGLFVYSRTFLSRPLCFHSTNGH